MNYSNSFFMIVFIATLLIGLNHHSVFSQSQSENIEQLFVEGDQALSQGDYIASLYYFRRMLESDQWENFNRKADVYYKIGILEESQSNSEAAALAFGRLVDYIKSEQSDLMSPMYSFYILKFTDSLERAGYYERAIKELWNLYDASMENQQANILRRLIKNYQFYLPSAPELEKVKTAVLPQYQNSLGWDLAELYVIIGKYEQAINLYDQLWANNIIQAKNIANELTYAYRQANLFEELLETVDQMRRSGSNMPYSLLLQVELLKSANQGTEALELIESQWQFSDSSNETFQPEQIIDQIPLEVLDVWVDLLENYDQVDKAILLLKAFLERNPMDINRRERLGNLLKNQNQIDAAIELWAVWAEQFNNNPVTALNAAEKMESLGALEEASKLLETVNDSLPPNLSLKQGQLLLNLNQIQSAYQAFNRALKSDQVNDDMIIEAVQDYTIRHNIDPLLAGLVEQASETPFAELPIWARQCLIKYGVENQNYHEALESLSEKEINGVWYYHIAQEAIRQNKVVWAEQLLNYIDPDDIYYSAAERNLAKLYSERNTIPMQQKAADLIRPSLAVILDASPPQPINETYADRLMDYAELRLNAFQPGEALIAIQHVESASSQIARLMNTSFSDRLKLNRARAMIELSSFQGAIPLLSSIQAQPYQSQALLLKARVLLALNELTEAHQVLEEIVQNPQHWQKKNDALALLSAMKPLIGDSLELFCTIQLYQLQGRYESADPVLRQLAVNHYGSDTEEWARFTIGQMYQQAGNFDKAQQEWSRLALDVDHPVIHGMLKYELLQQQSQIAGNVKDSTRYQEILIDFPNTLFSDLVRINN